VGHPNRVIAETPFLLSIAALSASLAGLAGLVAALRRGEGLGTTDRFRLHQIVEFCFANIILAIGIIPLVSITGSAEASLRIGGAVAFAYVMLNGLILLRRLRRMEIPLTRSALAVVVGIDVVVIVTSAAAALTGAVGAYEALLVALLARPMLAFLFVLSSFEAEKRPSPLP